MKASGTPRPSALTAAALDAMNARRARIRGRHGRRRADRL
jgi:hypothetical protein